MHLVRRTVAALGVTLLASAPLAAQLSQPLDSATLAFFRWRPIGPAVMGGRITDLAVHPTNPKTYWVAAAAGGIWKTTNGGTTFTPQFENEKVISLGALAVAPSNGDILYAGTGEEDSRNSISPGGGVYKSVDGGKTWKLSGLEATQHIGRIVVHPTDPNVVYVAALGRAWGTNPERGVYKTTDGGATWQLVKYVSPKAGAVDLAMDPRNPEVLWAAMWERQRGPWYLQSGGPGSGLFRTQDGGKTWTEVKGGGFPEAQKGRIGIALAPSNPDVVYAWVEADTNPRALKRGEKPDTTQRQATASGVYQSKDGGKTWTLMFRNPPGTRGFGDARPFYYSQIRVDPKNPERVYWMSSVFRVSDDGGKTARTMAGSIHTDWHAMWIDPKDPEHMIIGGDGGIAVSRDHGATFHFIDNLPLGQFYAISFDMAKPYNVCGGLQDNGSWCGPSRLKKNRGIRNEDWFNIGGGDGFFTAQDPENPNIVYAESQGGNISRLDLATGLVRPIRRSSLRNRVRILEDSLIILRGDTLRAITPAIQRELDRIQGRMRADSAEEMRFNWQTPYFLSPHNPRVVYAAGNKVLKSVNRGDSWTTISGDLSYADPEKIRISTRTTGGITLDNTGAETHGTITTLAESPLRPGILFAGTDDGRVWMTRNDGGSWEELTSRFPGVPRNTWVSRVEASPHDSATVFVSFDGHRTSDFAPYVFVSTDMGRTFRSIVGDLPKDGPAFVHVVRQDPVNPNLLFVGTDVAAYVSLDLGKTWRRFMSGMPTVPIHDLRIHPRDRELIAGTHGRSIYIADIAALQDMTSDSVVLAQQFLFAPKVAFQYAPRFEQGWVGDLPYRTVNPPYGATIAYRITKEDSAAMAARPQAQGNGNGAAAAPRRAPTAKIVISDLEGNVVRTLSGPMRAGFHRVTWDLRHDPAPLSPAGIRDSIRAEAQRRARQDSIRVAQQRDSAARPAGARGAARDTTQQAEQQPQFGQGGRPQRAVAPGQYLVTLTIGDKVLKRTITVERIGELPPDNAPGFGEYEEFMEEQDARMRRQWRTSAEAGER